jgi:hypothetical protein
MQNFEPTITTTSGAVHNYCQYLQQVLEIQSEAVRRLADCDGTQAIEVAAMLEDIANTFLNISDAIRDQALGRKPLPSKVVTLVAE